MVPRDIEDAIRKYFWQGFDYKTIHYLLERKHNFQIRYRMLKDNVIPAVGLQRRNCLHNLDLDRVLSIAIDELKNGCNGAEALRQTLKLKHNMNVPRKFVREAVGLLDVEGVQRRKLGRLRRRQYINKGPNYVWHIDGYDKLKPYGLPIHGCIDGFSRRMIWLIVGTTNNRSDVIAGHFIKSLKEIKGFPVKVRSDQGTENVMVKRMQRALADTDSAFILGSSTTNQRIERFWGLLRNYKADFWMDHFKMLIASGEFDRDNRLEIKCVQYAYLNYIQRELDDIKDSWNCHRIRQQHTGNIVSGVPELMYTNPELYGTGDYIVDCSAAELDYLYGYCGFDELDRDFKTVADEIVQAEQLTHPDNVNELNEAKQLFLNLRQFLLPLLLD